jgi:hypothetical protein
MWGNPTRKVLYNSKITFPAKRNHLQHPNSPTKIYLFSVPSLSCCTYYSPPRKCSTSKIVPTASCTNCFARLSSSKNAPRKLCQTHLDFCALSSCCTDPYSTASNNRKITQPQNKKSFLGICALAPLENMPFLLITFLSQAYSENLSQSPLNVSCTLPNAFFYKSKNDIFPPKCLFAFSNPKSKGQD